MQDFLVLFPFLWSVFMIKQLFVALFSDFVRNRMLCIYYNKGKL